ncbi:succinate dehydrogenase iron-sulfur protein [Bifidobacterium actinocoloniiforme DSM 22766]|uniref:succinate dehydrogenase n=1 Tax=Bifidobacterium actinocoloniiforme DSM 22766 TaxID=1437605 RepID=A0A086YZY9_9BIFI|nr:2Fe-2S iron-sulfur cluster-binding protein [Bifidobacterium actinocoloniiforme]AKV55115.1 hypothetical protein AB656_01300 [Bifidobacterium actinocoloniiforme DSM 22766]KFI39839.1 succinate dehydrogenase iron-sulfur protein [Bifidobacterium actinocoloniiforme DSM 22766]
MEGKRQRGIAAPTTLTIRVHRSKPLPRAQAQGGRARRSNPFASSGSNAPTRRSAAKRWVQDYRITAQPQDTLLDCLLSIKRQQDPSLAFRYSCGHGMCGSDGVLINGRPGLLCEATVAGSARSDPQGTAPFRPTTRFLPQHQGPATSGENPPSPQNALEVGDELIELAPLPGFPVLRDLVVDTDAMFRQIKAVHPWLGTGTVAENDQPSPGAPAVEVKQTPSQLKAYELLSDCISCGLCEAACPIYAGGEAFIGPAALVAAARFINDSRDDHAQDRLNGLDREDGLGACQSIRACARPCPRGIDVGETIWKLIESTESASHL